jgi:alpha-L-fucosidase
MVTSADGINWKKATEYALMPKRLPLEEGGEIKPDRMERPFVYVENDEPKVMSLAVKKGDESYIVFIQVKQEK